VALEIGHWSDLRRSEVLGTISRGFGFQWLEKH